MEFFSQKGGEIVEGAQNDLKLMHLEENVEKLVGIEDQCTCSRMCLDIAVRLSIAFSLTCSISSLNMSTRKSRAIMASSWSPMESFVSASTLADLTDKHSSSKPWTKAPQEPRATRLTWRKSNIKAGFSQSDKTWSACKCSLGASSAHFWPLLHSPLLIRVFMRSWADLFTRMFDINFLSKVWARKTAETP